MKQAKKLLLLSYLFVLYLNVHAQDCIVVTESLKGKYEGGCVKGKAEGFGKATGTDSYEGNFRNGQPDGIGKYNWKNQNYYSGSWKSGLRDGRGEMHYNTASGGDSIVSGYWKKDKYLGLYEKPYELIANTGKVTRVNCRISNKKGDDITFNVNKISEGLVSISDVYVLSGTYYNKNAQRMGNISVLTLKQVTFPFNAIFTLENGETVQILFNEKADYEVEIQVI